MECRELFVGVDVGSTTVKAVAVNPADKRIVWQDYRRHETKQGEKVLEMLADLLADLPDYSASSIRMFMTGSGAKPLTEPLGARFVQEVNAVTLAVETLHPDVGSVVELGGQDAKIIIFNVNPKTGEKQAVASMNDKCASGTGATIDKCMIKVGMPEDDVRSLTFNPDKLHKVAAKCGVFAETDIVNLVKAGIPSPEIMCSLADAIVTQNLSVLTRGNTLKHNVLLLGGPNTYLGFLQEAWRLRIQETWLERGYKTPAVEIDQLVQVPENAQYYAAFGAVVFGMDEPAGVGVFKGLEELKNYCGGGRDLTLSALSAGPLAKEESELEAFIRQYTIPTFTPATFEKGETVEGYVGLDGGSTSSKAVLIAKDKTILVKAYRLSKGNPIQDMRDLLTDLKEQVVAQGATLKVLGFGATGYAADVLEESVKADVNLVETIAHQTSATELFGEIDVICDIGGQDIKVLMLQNGEIKNFRLSNQCSAGNGMLLQAMADQFGVPLKEYADTAFKAKLSPKFSYGCAVFLDTDRVNFQKEGYNAEELLSGLAQVLPKNVWQYVVQIPRMAELGHRFVLQGGTQYNLAAVKAQVDYIKERVPGAEVYVHPHTGEAGAIGAALETLRVVERRGYSTFIGLEHAIHLQYTTKNDETTTCHFCPNLCPRTFIDTETPDGGTSRYIAGFSCEKGTVESKDALKELVAHRKQLKKDYVNLCEYESRVLFRSFYKINPLPESGSIQTEKVIQHRWFGKSVEKEVTRAFAGSSQDSQEKRKGVRIGIPRVLNIWSTAPLWKVYFETLGIPKHHIVFSDETSEEMWKAGAKYGSVDPCYPSKVIQAHYHDLLFEKHSKKKPLNYIFAPSMTHIPSFVEDTVENTTCPIVSGSSCVTHASFTKEKDFFADLGIEHVTHAVTLEEKHMLKEQMFQMWGERLGVTKDESDFAMEQGWLALDELNADLERKGMSLLLEAEENNKMVLLLLARPYHLDPGLNHQVLEEFQAKGYPVLSIRSIPKDKSYLQRFFNQKDAQGNLENPLTASDVWPENYSVNSVQKVWAAKFAARHPNVAVLDLSSFKCGHDAPTYGLIDSIIKESKTPYMALHDIDANKPAGSLKIRVSTFCHTLKRACEELEDKAKKRSELEIRIAQKRKELYAQYFQENPSSEGLQTTFNDYVDEEETIKGLSVFGENLESMRDDIAPLSPQMEMIALSGKYAANEPDEEAVKFWGADIMLDNHELKKSVARQVNQEHEVEHEFSSK